MIVGVGKRGTGSGVARWREVGGPSTPEFAALYDDGWCHRGALGRVRAFHSIQSDFFL